MSTPKTHGGARKGAGRPPSGKPSRKGAVLLYRVPADRYAATVAAIESRMAATGQRGGEIIADAVALLPDMR